MSTARNSFVTGMNWFDINVDTPATSPSDAATVRKGL